MFKKGEYVKIISLNEFYKKLVSGNNYRFIEYKARMSIYDCYGKTGLVLGCDYGNNLVHLELTDRYDKRVEVSLPFEFITSPKNAVKINIEYKKDECDWCNNTHNISIIKINTKQKGSKELHLCDSCKREFIKALAKDFGL